MGDGGGRWGEGRSILGKMMAWTALTADCRLRCNGAHGCLFGHVGEIWLLRRLGAAAN